MKLSSVTVNRPDPHQTAEYDLVENEAVVLHAGATKFEGQPNVNHCLILAEPAGHLFCLTTVGELG